MLYDGKYITNDLYRQNTLNTDSSHFLVGNGGQPPTPPGNKFVLTTPGQVGILTEWTRIDKWKKTDQWYR